MKKLLFLYGLHGSVSVWDDILDKLDGVNAVFAQYPHEITQAAHTVQDITRWVHETYGGQSFDAVVGHSMGGLIALELAARYSMDCGAVIMIETNLRPAGAFYRNLMLPENMVKHGDRVNGMLRGEAPYYTDALKRSVQEDFDFTPYVHKISAKLFGIYGNRGLKHYRRRIADLCLDKATTDMISFKFVKNACHMPMIENPQALMNAMMGCLP